MWQHAPQAALDVDAGRLLTFVKTALLGLMRSVHEPRSFCQVVSEPLPRLEITSSYSWWSVIVSLERKINEKW